MGEYRLKRWLPRISFLDATVGIPGMLVLSLLFLTGQDLVWGLEDGELHTLPFPKVPAFAYVLFFGVLLRFLPPATTIRLNRLMRYWKRRLRAWWVERRRDRYGAIDGHH